MTQVEQATERDARPLARRDRGLPCRRGTCNPKDPLSRRGFANGSGPAASTVDTDAESQQDVFSWLGSDAPVSARLAAVRAGWADTRRAAAQRPTWGGTQTPQHRPCTSTPIALAGSALSLGTRTTPTPPTDSPPTPPDDLFLAPAFAQTLAAELAVDALFGPILRGGGGAAAALGRLVDRLGTPIVDRARSPKGGTPLVHCGLMCTAAGRARRTVSAFPPAADCVRRYFLSATMARQEDILGVPRQDR